jgi:hypothetical protein
MSTEAETQKPDHKPQPINDPKERRYARERLARLQDQVEAERPRLLRAFGQPSPRKLLRRIYQQSVRCARVGAMEQEAQWLRLRLEAS